MRTNIVIDDQLMAEAMALSGATTKREAVDQALRLLVKLERQGQVRDYLGKLEWEGDHESSRQGRFPQSELP